MKKLKALFSAFILALSVIGMAYGDNIDMSVTVVGQNPVVDSVVVNDASPTSGTTTQITVTTQVTDTNGVDDIDVVNASFTVGNPANGKTITVNMRSGCSNVDTDTIECSATYNMQFYDDAMTYTVQVYAEDANGGSDTGTDTFAYSELVSLDIDVSAIAFGSMDVGETKEVLGDDTWSSGTATIKNQGNVLLDAKVNASDFDGSTDSFGADQAQIKFDALSYFALSNAEQTEASLDLAKGVSSVENVDLKLTIPTGALPESYTSTMALVGVKSS